MSLRNRTRVLVERLASRAKGSTYEISEKVKIRDLIEIVAHRFFMLTRGFFRGLRFDAGFPLFMESGVLLRGRSYLKLGKGVTIYRGVELHGLAENGLRIGDGSSIGAHSILRSTLVLNDVGMGIELGKNVGIGPFSFIGGFGGVRIGDNTIIGHALSIHSDNHRFHEINVVIRDQGVEKQKVIIGKDCWFGSHVTVLGGVTVGDGCVIGAGSVVTKDLPPGAVAVGVPCRVLRIRGAYK
ncbi:MAG: acyltransferase [Acidobacteria bacterium]|nr:acyltransferase [Acidobacteriota bacterium]